MMNLLSDKSKELMKRENAFDFLRYFLMLSVFISHFFDLNAIDKPWWCISGLIRIRAFFIISGFLVFYTFNKNQNLKVYVEKRARRILPPYILIVVLCFALGVIVSDLSFVQYFTSTETYKYLITNLGFMNFLQPTLPGVFDTNPVEAVNGALWTMKVELMFYVSVPIVFFLMTKFNKLYVIIGVLLFSLFYDWLFTELYNHTLNNFYLLLRKQVGGQFMYFYSGTLILLYFETFIKYLKYLLPIGIACYAMAYYNIVFSYLEPLSFAIVIIGLSYVMKYFFFLRKYENVSYGMYLFHFPVIQVFIYYNVTQYNVYLSFFGALLITTLLSIASWKLLEKPIIKQTFKAKITQLIPKTKANHS